MLGAAILGSVAAGVHPDVSVAMAKMSSLSEKFAPQSGAVSARHDTRFAIFEQLQSIARQAAQLLRICPSDRYVRRYPFIGGGVSRHFTCTFEVNAEGLLC